MSRTNLTGPEPREVWSINLGTMKFYAALFSQLVAVALIAWGAVQWTGRSIFESELNEFHKKAIPEIKEMIDDAINDHNAEAMILYAGESAEQNERLAILDQRLEYTNERITRIEHMIEIMFKERRNAALD